MLTVRFSPALRNNPSWYPRLSTLALLRVTFLNLNTCLLFSVLSSDPALLQDLVLLVIIAGTAAPEAAPYHFLQICVDLVDDLTFALFRIDGAQTLQSVG